MTGRSVIHDTFAIERSYLAIPSRVFAAFASTDAKSNWRWIDRLAEDDGAVAAEFDFRIGGRERFGFKRHGTAFRYDARYYDSVPDQRIIAGTRAQARGRLARDQRTRMWPRARALTRTSPCGRLSWMTARDGAVRTWTRWG